MEDTEKDYKINCVGIDDKLHICFPWEGKAVCGVKVKTKGVKEPDFVKKYWCYECSYSCE